MIHGSVIETVFAVVILVQCQKFKQEPQTKMIQGNKSVSFFFQAILKTLKTSY